MKTVSKCCKSDTRLGYKNMSEDSSVVIASPSIVCVKCVRPCEVLNVKELRREKIKKLNNGKVRIL